LSGGLGGRPAGIKWVVIMMFMLAILKELPAAASLYSLPRPNGHGLLAGFASRAQLIVNAIQEIDCIVGSPRYLLLRIDQTTMKMIITRIAPSSTTNPAVAITAPMAVRMPVNKF